MSSVLMVARRALELESSTARVGPCRPQGGDVPQTTRRPTASPRPGPLQETPWPWPRHPIQQTTRILPGLSRIRWIGGRCGACA